MNELSSVPDRNGQKVEVGSRVRVIALGRAEFQHLSDQEFIELSQKFVGASFEVEQIDEYGQAWVGFVLHLPGDRFDCENIGLSSAEMERCEGAVG